MKLQTAEVSKRSKQNLFKKVIETDTSKEERTLEPKPVEEGMIHLVYSPQSFSLSLFIVFISFSVLKSKNTETLFFLLDIIIVSSSLCNFDQEQYKH